MMKSLPYVLVLLLFFCRCAYATPFQATPLIDFGADEKYLGAFHGLLYNGSNELVPGSQHDLDGLMAGGNVQPLDANGLSSPSGKIVVVGIGNSNWTIDLCARVTHRVWAMPVCTPASFIAHAQPSASPFVRIIDCANVGQTAVLWVNDAFSNWSRCNHILASKGLSPAQVQVILWHDANSLGATVSLKPTTNCSILSGPSTSTPDACNYIYHAAKVMRFAKTWYPHTQQIFLNSSGYNGYVSGHEPFSYENGFAVKWLIKAQIDQIASGHIVNRIAGDLSYAKAPWMAWGDYMWASDSTPRSDGLTWLPSDYLSDLIHPSQAGVLKSTNLMMDYYFTTSPYTPWIRK